MRKVIFKIELSLDGLIAGPNGEMEWGTPKFGAEENWQDVFDMLSSVDTVLMSRVIYQIFRDFWPAAATDPSRSTAERKFSGWLDNAPKIVFSKSLESVDWKNARLVNGDVGQEIARLKEMPGRNLVLWGGSIFPQALMNLGLIDEYRINVHPVVLGQGKPLFTDIKNRIPLDIVSTRTFTSGAIGLCYQPARP